MQVGPDSGARDTWNDYLERYVEWNYALPRQSIPYVYRNPDLVGDIYILETGRKEKPRLFLLNLDKRRIEASRVPPELVNLLPRLEASSADLPTALNAWRLHDVGVDQSNQTESSPTSNVARDNAIAGWQFDGRAPAIVHPIFHRYPGKPLSIQRPVDWIVITMDMNILAKRVLPELTGRYFVGPGDLDYKVRLIATGKAPRVIYASDPGELDMVPPDSTMNIFDPLPDMNEDLIHQNERNSNTLRDSQRHSSFGLVWFPTIEFSDTQDSWVLELRHRSGPLQAVIDRARQRNLVISAFLFLLLGLNISVLTIAGFRAQKFARLQMDFVASVSHELRTPLAAIFSAGENIRDGVVTEKSSLQQYGALILSQCRQLIRHVDRVMLFASMRSGKDRYNIRALEVSEILRSVCNSTSALVSEESCVVEVYVESAVSRVMGDMFAVRGCLENLITNAVKYRRGDNLIRISAGREWSPGGKQMAAISVEDHGIGIEKAELDKVFEPFYRCPRVIERQIKGSGLGLCLAKHLADSIGGSLSVVSEFGVGSIFTLHLPLAPEEDAETTTVGSRVNEGEAK